MLSPETAAALGDTWAFFLHLTVVLVPLFVLGSFLVALAQEYLPPERVERVLRRYDGGVGNVVAAGFGAVTPFCSCSTVPMLAGLLQARAPLGIALSFLLASPLVNELAVLLLVGLFGVEVAAYYVAVTLLSAVVLGAVLGRLGLESHLKDVDLFAPDGRAVATDGGQCVTVDGTCVPSSTADGGGNDCGCGCGSETGRTGHSGEPHLVRIRRAALGTGTFFRGLVPYLLLGLVAGSLIHGVVPAVLLERYLGPSNPFAVPLAAVAGAPIYVSMSAMLPIAASLTEQGVPVGTVLAFVVGSAGVSVPNLVLLNKLFDRTLLVVYAAAVVTVGIVLGLLFNVLLV
jgi:hypothetical protein